MMDQVIIYIHGQGGNVDEAKHYEALFENQKVIGIDYKSETPWEAAEEFSKLYDDIAGEYKSVILIANSIGAYFAMSALAGKKIEKAIFISPIVDMEKLIMDMMGFANISENELRDAGVIKTSFGQTLSWEYLSYVRKHQINWTIPTDILYGEKDAMTSFETISKFAKQVGSKLTVMKNGEHWFHTEEQMSFLDDWISKIIS